MKIQPTNILTLITLSLILTALTGQTMAAAPANKAGTGEAVKTWKSETNDQATAAHKPLLLYIYDATGKKNDTALTLEGATFLDSADVKAKEKDFACIKIKSTDGDGFPHDWMVKGDNGAAVLVITADMKLIQAFDKTTKDTNTAATLIAAMDAAVKAGGIKQANNDKKDAGADKKAPAKKNNPKG